VSWLVTGGAGYIGAHVVHALRADGLDAVVVDDLSSGRQAFVPEDVPLVEGSVLDVELLRRVLREYAVEGIVHVAGFKYAGVSVQRPLHTFRQNLQGTVSVLEAAEAEGVEPLVFSSTAAVYGTPSTEIVDESSPTRPESPYGESKLAAEWAIADQARRGVVRATALRYFNVVGSAVPSVYDASPHNLLPLVFEALLAGRTPRINGTDYPTPDGTCVRDYVHVGDLALAHVVAARALAEGRPLAPVYNLGSGTGVSVREIMTAVARATGIAFEPEEAPRRAGDPARIVASGELAAAELGWAMRHSVDEMVADAWNARRAALEP